MLLGVHLACVFESRFDISKKVVKLGKFVYNEKEMIDRILVVVHKRLKYKILEIACCMQFLSNYLVL